VDRSYIGTSSWEYEGWLDQLNLRNKTGEPVEVFPLVVLPGWFVKKPVKRNFRVFTMNGNYLPGFLRRKGKESHRHKCGESSRHWKKNAGMWNFNPNSYCARVNGAGLFPEFSGNPQKP
jgi:hypothetical protein